MTQAFPKLDAVPDHAPQSDTDVLETLARELDVIASLLHVAGTLIDAHDASNLVTAASTHVEAARALAEATLDSALRAR
ncbi:hypothetical protein AB3X94_08060 [Paraburkholderia sp. BR10923]|uniref:hypothetical protein n=1 Tax=Paraburkholderia sp. BR10923 TaxID=3236992 RepID=UPI0034CD0369